MEELTEERSLQSSAATSTSLLSEIEQSMEAEELEQEREQVPKWARFSSSSSALTPMATGWGVRLTGQPLNLEQYSQSTVTCSDSPLGL